MSFTKMKNIVMPEGIYIHMLLINLLKYLSFFLNHLLNMAALKNLPLTLETKKKKSAVNMINRD